MAPGILYECAPDDQPETSIGFDSFAHMDEEERAQTLLEIVEQEAKAWRVSDQVASALDRFADDKIGEVELFKALGAALVKKGYGVYDSDDIFEMYLPPLEPDPCG